MDPEIAAGYCVDEPYTVRYFEECAPVNLKMAAALNGCQSTPLNKPFTYLELGCGNAVSLCIFAAANPLGTFIGVDFMPQHIKFSKQLAEVCGITNITFIESSFGELPLKKIPDCDFIVARGILSWVQHDVRDQVRDIVKEKLKPNGVYYVNYNANPGWLAAQPLHDLLSHGFEAEEGQTTLERLNKNHRLIEELIKHQASYFKNNGESIKIFEELRKQSANFLIHDFMHEKVESFYIREVAAHYADIGLEFAGNSIIHRNYYGFYIQNQFQNILKEQKDRLGKEHIVDFIMNTMYRQDVFMHKNNVENLALDDTSLIEDIIFTSTTTAEVLEKGVKLSHMTYTFDGDVNNCLKKHLPGNNHTIETILALDELKEANPLEVFNRVKIMAALKCVQPCVTAFVTEKTPLDAAQKEVIGKLNTRVFQLFLSQNLPVPLVSSVAGAAIWIPLAVAKYSVALLLNENDVSKAWRWIVERTTPDKQEETKQRKDQAIKILEDIKEKRLPFFEKMGVNIS